MSSIATVIASNVEALRTGRNIVAALSDELYNVICSPHTTASIGAHFRHVIDHYECLFAGLSCGAIDYDQRARDPLVEQHTVHALQRLDASVDALHTLQTSAQSSPNIELSVSLSTTVNNAGEAPFASTLQRELVFLHGHTTHHLSMVAMLLRLVNVPVDATLGVAPSTLAYQEQSRCAR